MAQESWVRNAGQTRYNTTLNVGETLFEQVEDNKIIVDLGRGDYDIKKARKLIDTVSVTNNDSVTPESLSVTCIICGKNYKAQRSTSKFCSANCRKQYSRK